VFSVWFPLVVFAVAGAAAQTSAPIDIEALPAISELPDPFLRDNGQRIHTPAEWKAQRKTLLDKALRYEYGALPPAARNVSGKEISSHPMEGLSADEKVIALSMGPRGAVTTHITLTLPHGAGPFPVIVCGDYIAGDKSWKKIDPAIVEMIVKRGYALAEFDRVEIAPDSAARTGVYAAYPDYEGGRPAAWAWGYHRVIDYLIAQPYTDRKRIVVTGHSRGGKAVLLAGATDERIAVTAPNNSGCGGAGCYRYQAPKSEDITAILKNFPFWFQPEFNKFIGHIDRLPIDQHIVKALVAPRALLSTEGLEDLWANPEGTQISYLAAHEVYDFLGVRDRIGIAYRPGGHEHGMTDWVALLDFSDWQLFGKQPGRSFHDLPFPNAPRPFSWRAPGAHSNTVSGNPSDYHGLDK
jgi:dienelactone hydrolase